MRELKSLFEPSISLSYLQLMVDMMTEHNIGIDALLENTGLPPEHLKHINARMSAFQWGLVVANALRLSGISGLGYEYGLRMQLSAHGFLGFAIMSSPTIKDALNTLLRYFPSRQYNLTLHSFVENESQIIEMVQKTPFSMGHPLFAIKSFMFEALLIGIVKGIAAMLQRHDFSDAIVCFDYSEPDYFAAYRNQLPKILFDQPTYSIRFPLSLLELRPAMADLQAAQQAIELCEKELVLAGKLEESTGQQVRALLVVNNALSLEEVAIKLQTSSRRLARKLHTEGYLFSQLQEEARKRDALHLIEYTELEFQQIADMLGYLNPANFTRAFRNWTSETPSQYRARLRQDSAIVKEQKEIHQTT